MATPLAGIVARTLGIDYTTSGKGSRRERGEYLPVNFNRNTEICNRLTHSLEIELVVDVGRD